MSFINPYILTKDEYCIVCGKFISDRFSHQFCKECYEHMNCVRNNNTKSKKELINDTINQNAKLSSAPRPVSHNKPNLPKIKKAPVFIKKKKKMAEKKNQTTLF